MKLAPGARLGPYEILAPLGAGGMGEVYSARDTRLGRTVAVKILPAKFAQDSKLKSRFEHEAKAISALSHPHICALYDVGPDYLVMEYCEGKTLARRIDQGALSAEQVIEYGIQIAGALEKAHRAGIIHRDLKPSNIMITKSGLKLLDFGLAKQHAGSSPEESTAAQLTEEGKILGTIQYMAPELLQGKEADARSDIFALGLVLYEMAAGKPAFSGTSRASLIASILEHEPPHLDSSAPLDRLIHACLAKDPDERIQSASDVRLQLRWLADDGRHASSPARKHRWIPIVAAIAGAALIGAAITRYVSPAAKPASARLSIAPPDGVTIYNWGQENAFALSPDGRTVVYTGVTGGATALFLRRLDSTETEKIEGTDGATLPFWSSDGEWLGFSLRGKMWKKRVRGASATEPIVDLESVGARATWSGHTILYSERAGGPRHIFRVSDGGGKPEAVTRLEEDGEYRHSFPEFLPDGNHFIYGVSVGTERRLLLAALDAPSRTVLARNVSQARAADAQRLLYVRDGRLLIHRLDIDKRALIGEPVAVAEHVEFFQVTMRAEFDVAGDTIVYRTNTSTGRVVLLNRRGGVVRVIDDQGLFREVAFSPDGRKAAVSVDNRANGLSDLWIYDLARGVRDRFTTEPPMETSPLWMPDGRAIVYAMGGGSRPSLLRRSISLEPPEQLTTGETMRPGSVAPDGRWAYYSCADPITHEDILRVRLDGSHEVETVLRTNFNEDHPAVSPDGKWLAFITDDTGVYEIYVQSLAGGERVRISANGGWLPRWRRDSGELFFVAGKSIVSAVPRAPGRWDEVTIEPLFSVANMLEHFDVAPDGQSFLVVEERPGAADGLLQVILGWKQ